MKRPRQLRGLCGSTVAAIKKAQVLSRSAGVLLRRGIWLLPDCVEEKAFPERDDFVISFRCEHRTLSLSKLADLASPILMQTASMGKTIPKAKLEFMRADGDGKPVKYYQVELENVMIAHIDQLMRDSGLLHDEIGLRFSKIKWSYTQQKIGGGAGGSTVGGWDLACNKCA